MNRIGALILTIFLAGLCSCEEITDTNELPFEERLVISGVLRPDLDENVVQITKTLPLNVPFDTNIAFLRDASGLVSSEGVDYPLEYIGYSGYYRIKGIKPAIGNSYRLDVSWKHLHAFAETSVPSPSAVDSVSYKEVRDEFDNDKEYEFTIWARVPYGESARIGVDIPIEDTTLPDWFRNSSPYYLHRGSNEQVVVRSRLGHFFEQEYETFYVGLYTYAPGFYEYAETRYSDPDDPFSSSGAPTQWNIQGDGIGGFFGSVYSVYSYDF
jgi:hypothetical protein